MAWQQNQVHESPVAGDPCSLQDGVPWALQTSWPPCFSEEYPRPYFRNSLSFFPSGLSIHTSDSYLHVIVNLGRVGGFFHTE